MKRYIKASTDDWLSDNDRAWLSGDGRDLYDDSYLRDEYVIPIMWDVLGELEIDEEVSGYMDAADLVFLNYHNGTHAIVPLYDAVNDELELVISSNSAEEFRSKFKAYLQSLDYK